MYGFVSIYYGVCFYLPVLDPSSSDTWDSPLAYSTRGKKINLLGWQSISFYGTETEKCQKKIEGVAVSYSDVVRISMYQ